MKTNIRNAAWVIGVLLLAGFCLVGCDRRLDVRTVYPFQVTTMPILKSLVPGEEVEIRCTLAPERIVKGTRYTLRYFQYDGSGALRIGRRSKPPHAERSLCHRAGTFHPLLPFTLCRTTIARSRDRGQPRPESNARLRLQP